MSELTTQESHDLSAEGKTSDVMLQLVTFQLLK